MTATRTVRTLLLLLAALPTFGSLVTRSAVAQAPFHVYLTWQGDTGTTMTVNFHSRTPMPAAVVLYDTEPRGPDTAAYRYRAAGDSLQITGVADGRRIHRVELTDLTPGETYYFAAGDSERGFTEERSFRTIPDSDAPLRFATGGDMGVDESVRTLLRHAAGRSPQFALIGGDLAYANGEPDNVDLWDAWLGLWEDEMVTPEGLTVPMVAAVGNHEVRGGYDGEPEDAPFYLGLLGQNGETSYFRREFGRLAVVYVLDSGHLATHAGRQADWLESQLQADQDVPYRFAAYHVPLFPSHRSFDGTESAAGRASWAPLFDRHGLTAAFENHDHTFKRTRLIRNGAVAGDEGVLYIGDGAWGRGPRTINLTPRWYLSKAGAQQHVWIVDVSQDEVVYRAVDINGREIDVYPPTAPGAVEADAYFGTLTQLYELQEESVVLEPVITSSAVVDRDSVAVRLHNREGYAAHAEVRFEVEPPLTVEPEERSLSLAAGEDATLTFALSVSPPVAVNAVPPAYVNARLIYDTPHGDVRLDQRRRLGIEALLEAPAAPDPVRIDGRLDEWGALPFAFDRPAGERLTEEDFITEVPEWAGPSDSSIRFSVGRDDRYVYLALDVVDDDVHVDPDVQPWNDARETIAQDGVGIWLDPYPGGDGDDDPLLVISPGDDAARIAAGEDDDILSDVRVALVLTPTGYTIETAIPSALIHEGEAPTEHLRLNLAMGDTDDPDEAPHFYFWRPSWESDDDFRWSGVFKVTDTEPGAPD